MAVANTSAVSSLGGIRSSASSALTAGSSRRRWPAGRPVSYRGSTKTQLVAVRVGDRELASAVGGVEERLDDRYVVLRVAPTARLGRRP